MDPATLSLIVGALIKYGPDIASKIMGLFQKQVVTVQDIEDLFSQVKTYESYGIPDKPPTLPIV